MSYASTHKKKHNIKQNFTNKLNDPEPVTYQTKNTAREVQQ